MTKQSEAHEALVELISSEIMKAPHKLIEYSIWERRCARAILAIIAERLADVTEEMVAAHRGLTYREGFLDMLAASPLVPGDGK